MMKVLALGAHFDDVELGCGGALIKHARRGDEVTIFVVTDSAFRDPEGRLVRPEGIPSKEGRASADRIGAKLICGDFPTNNTLFDERLVVAVRRIVDKTPFDLVYTHWSGDVHL
ncbi:MAG: PIG-L family deacetylase, partial [Pseudomonadota bacterium]